MKLDRETWTRVYPFLEQAYDISAAELPAWLAKLEQEQPEIGSALRSILEQGNPDQASQFLAEPVSIEAEKASQIGQRIGPYTIESLLGVGGMGEVWLAQRTDGHFKGFFAIKFLDLSTTSPRALDRFRREGRMLARLAHPNIARLIDAGVASSGQPYLVLEYVKGEHIDQYYEAHSLSLEERVRMFLHVLAAVAHAHTNLVVHRDIKPSNVLVTPEGTVKLLDFGIAKLIGNELAPEDQAQATRIEDVALTPNYAAPEQILGEPPSTATDVYQLGVLLYVLLVGRLPLQRELSKSRSEQIRAALEDIPARLSDVAAGAARKALRGDLDAIVGKSLRKRPEERYATAAALAADLQRYLDHEPVAAREGALAYRAGKFVRRYRSAVIASGIAALALLATTTFALVQMRESDVQRDQATVMEKRALAESQFLTQIMSTVSSNGQPVTPAQILEKGMGLLERTHANDPEFRFAMFVNMATLFGDMDDHERAYGALHQAEAIAVQLDDPALLAEVRCDIVDSDLATGNVEQAKKNFGLAQQALARNKKPAVKARAICLEAESGIADNQGNTAQALALVQRALALMDEGGLTNDVLYNTMLSNIGFYYHEMGDAPHAFEYTQRQVRDLERMGWGESQQSVTAHHNVATVLMTFGEVTSALQAEEQTLLRARSSTTDGVVNPRFLMVYGQIQMKLAQYAVALEYFDLALVAAQRGKDMLTEVGARSTRADALIALGRLDEARAEIGKLRKLSEAQDTITRRARALGGTVEAKLLLAEGQAEQGRRSIEALIESLRGDEAIGAAALPPALIVASRAEFAAGRFADAEARARELLALYKKNARKDESSGDVGEALLLIAQAQAAQGQQQLAMETARRADVSLRAGLGAQHPLTLMAANIR